ncbi:hypothetical protein SAMN05661091_2663 [Paenibacillus uliginis N3/975]|uniref:Uncharacterized protein n=1 Tax=Paenibacillus uliginis N3/975 TaxID=1313296 RepID=A0A1X7HDN5_9BACL|nr:hypothetical protein [Paenibacillus uliginis]SMF84596.1 hypothetical protein SAMN05661091_2663 [Paenibacillus uliginis N3/975]
MKKRRKIILLSIPTAILVILFVSILFNKTSRTTFESLAETDQQMLTELSNVYKQFEQSSDQLWSDQYSFETKPLLLVRTNKDRGIFRKEAFAVNVPMGNSVFAKEIKMPESLGLPKVYRISRFSPATLTTWLPINFGTLNIKDTETMYYRYYPKMLSDPELYFDFSSFLLHEAFHIFKQKHWTYDANDAEWIENYPEKQEHYALMGMEFKLLDQAMTATNPQSIKQNLHDWTVVRNYRYQKWPQLIGEIKTEAIEGTARYIEYRYNELMGRKLTVLAAKQEPYHVTFMQVFDFIASDQMEPAFLKRSMRYETGAALGLMMDKANIPWKEAIEDEPDKPGMTQYEILNDYFKVQDTAVEAEIEELKETYDYKGLLQQGKKIEQRMNVDQ